VLLDLPVARAREQVRRKSPRGYTQLAEDVLEGANAHLEAAADIYRELAADPRWAAVDAGREQEEVANEIWRLVEERR
jgi:thymidylate kinase